MKRAEALGGASLVNTLLAKITQFHHPIRFANVFVYPKYSRDTATYDNARKQLAGYIEAHQQQ